MYELLKRILILPPLNLSEDDLRSARLLNSLLLSLMVSLLCALIAVPFIYTQKLKSSLFIIFFFTILVTAKSFMHRGYVQTGKIIFLSGSWIISALFIVVSGGITTTNASYFVSVTILSGLLMGRKAAIIVAFLSIATGLAIAVFSVMNMLPVSFFPVPLPPFSGWINLTIALIMATTALYLTLQSLEDALAIARQKIHEREVAEEKLVQEKNFSDAIINNMPGVFAMCAEDGSIIRWNKNIESVLGYSSEDLIRMDAVNTVNPEGRDYSRKYIQEIFSGSDKGAEEVVAITKTGSRIPFYINAHKIILGDKKYILGFGIDISDLKKAEEERQKLLEQIRYVQKLESLGVLAGGIAHDFNNLLMAILGNVELALIDRKESDPAYHNLTEIKKITRRAADLTSQMLAYSGKGRFVVEKIDLPHLVAEMASMLDVSISKKASIIYDFAVDTPSIDADATQIRQVIMNLITNASDAIGESSGTITISTGKEYCDGRTAEKFFPDIVLPAGDYAFLEVSDSGIGMDQDTIGKIFDPFFTTKFTGRGLGLAAVSGIVKGHMGTIRIESVPGMGSSFRVLFPSSRISEQANILVETKEKDNWHGTGTILLVEDEESVRMVASKMLNHIGFNVIGASDGKEAIKLFMKNASDIACVILDLTMPQMDGKECFVELKRIRPDIPVILSSGYMESDSHTELFSSGIAGFLHKPYYLKNMRHVLSTVFKG